MHTIALVEDNDDLRNLTEIFLERQGYSVLSFSDAEEFLSAETIPDLYVIDINLPEMSGLELITHIRRTSPNVGVIVLSARERANEVAAGYSAGADIYLTKPTDPQVLLAAIKRIIDRHRASSPRPSQVEVSQNSLRYQGTHLRLSSKEAVLLHRLSLAGARGMERHELAACLELDLDRDVSKALEVRILRLRRKLSQLGLPDTSIETIRGFGYRLNTPVRFLE